VKCGIESAGVVRIGDAALNDRQVTAWPQLGGRALNGSVIAAVELVHETLERDDAVNPLRATSPALKSFSMNSAPRPSSPVTTRASEIAGRARSTPNTTRSCAIHVVQ
jgi:hypothetical protein